jgi:hypothetical protein
MVRDPERLGWRQIEATNAWKDGIDTAIPFPGARCGLIGDYIFPCDHQTIGSASLGRQVPRITVPSIAAAMPYNSNPTPHS